MELYQETEFRRFFIYSNEVKSSYKYQATVGVF